MNMQSLMAQAQKMQKDIMKKKENVGNMHFVGKSEMVEVVFDGNKKMLSASLKQGISLESDDTEILLDMFVIAVNDAMKQIDDTMEKEMGVYSSSLNGLF